MPMVFSEVAAASLRGATPMVRRAPRMTAFIRSSSVGDSSRACLWTY